MTDLQVILLLNCLLELSSTEETEPRVSCRSIFFLLVLVVFLLLLHTFLVELADDGEQLHIEVLLRPLDLLFPHVDLEIPWRAKGKKYVFNEIR